MPITTHYPRDERAATNFSLFTEPSAAHRGAMWVGVMAGDGHNEAQALLSAEEVRHLRDQLNAFLRDIYEQRVEA